MQPSWSLRAEGSGSENIGMPEGSQGISHSGEGAELSLWRERSHVGSPPRDLVIKMQAPVVVTKTGTGGQGVGTLGGSHVGVVAAGPGTQVQAEASLVLDTVSESER